MKHYWNVFWLFRKMRFMAMLEYRSDFFFWSFVNVMWTTFNFLFFDILLSATGNLGSWTKTDMYFLLANFTILDAFIWSLIYKNMKAYTQSIFEGSLDTILLKPMSTQYLLWIRENTYTGLFRMLTGLSVLIYMSMSQSITPTFSNFILYLLTMVTGIILMYSLWFTIATIAFYVDKLDNINEIFPNLRRLFEVPRTVYTGSVSYMVTAVIPLALIATIPTEIFLNKPDWPWVLFFFFITAVWFLVSRAFFTFSLSKYSSVGS